MGGLVERLELTLRVVEHCQRTPLAVKTYKRALEALAEGLVSAGEMITEPDNSEMITAAVAAVSENEDALIAEQKKASAATSKARVCVPYAKP
jgi:flagellar motor switch protein FliM